MSEQPPPPPAENLSLEEALRYAVDLHQQGFVEGAAELYARILALVPDHADALNFRGMALAQLGHRAEGLGLLERASALVPNSPDILNNLGSALFNLDRFEEAVVAYKRSAELRPDYVEAYQNLGQAYDRLERHEEALAAFQRALFLQPYDPENFRRLGMTYYSVGRIDEAANLYRRWLEAAPDDPQARHMLAACTGKEVPPRAHDIVVKRTFDSFANSFDGVLKNLQYQAPLLIADKVTEHLGPAPASPTATVLDLGCGTGLCGALLRPHASRLVGLDLSAKMLARARDRGCYDELVEGELTAYLTSTGGAFDLITAGDVLCYLGDLAPVMTAASAALRPSGWLMFTVEAASDGAPTPYVLHPHGRYSHRGDFLRTCLAAAGLSVVVVEQANLRVELKKPVDGFVVVARRS